MSRPIVDLPHPLSPTRPNVLPGRMARSTPSTALTQPVTFCRKPLRTGKYFLSPSTLIKALSDGLTFSMTRLVSFIEHRAAAQVPSSVVAHFRELNPAGLDGERTPGMKGTPAR